MKLVGDFVKPIGLLGMWAIGSTYLHKKKQTPPREQCGCTLCCIQRPDERLGILKRYRDSWKLKDVWVPKVDDHLEVWEYSAESPKQGYEIPPDAPWDIVEILRKMNEQLEQEYEREIESMEMEKIPDGRIQSQEKLIEDLEKWHQFVTTFPGIWTVSKYHFNIEKSFS